jgi:hypothetical protein
MVQMDLEGNKLDGDLNPSSDEPTHRVLYSADSEINGVVHTQTQSFVFDGRVALTLIILIADMLLKVINLKKERINGES